MLEPAPSAQPVAGYELGAFDADNGVLGIAQVEAWDGDVILRKELTPIKLMIDNHRAQPILVRLDRIRLLGDSGHVSTALAPRKITGSAPTDQALPLYRPLDPYFFDVSESHKLAYPGPAGYDTGFPASTGAPANYYGYRDVVDLPTPYMLNAAIMEGTLAAGAQNVGFVYFEPLPESAEGFVLECQFTAAEGGEPVARLRFPFRVTS